MQSVSSKNIDELFKIWKQGKSSRELAAIEPRRLADDLRITETEADNYMNELVKNNKALRMFCGKCPNDECDEDFCIEQSAALEKYQCPICETSFRITDDNIGDIDVCYDLIDKEDEKYSGVNYKDKYLCKDVNTTPTNTGGTLKVKGSENVICMPMNGKNKNEDQETQLSIFISHNEKDSDLADIVIQLLEDIGVSKSVKDNKIFCSSATCRGVKLGDDIFETIKNKFDENIIVLFLFTENFYESAACMCEMGAAWVKGKDVLSLIVPPQKFENIKGIINKNIKGIQLNDADKFLELVDYFKEKFNLADLPNADYENVKRRFIKGVNNFIGNK